MKKKAVIIGAGPAGITAGCELLKNSDEYDVVILEQSDSIGGISRTVNHEGNRMVWEATVFFQRMRELTDGGKRFLRCREVRHLMILQPRETYIAVKEDPTRSSRTR